MARLTIIEEAAPSQAAPFSPAVIGIVGRGTATTTVNVPTEVDDLDDAVAKFGAAGTNTNTITRAVAGALHANGRPRIIASRYNNLAADGTTQLAGDDLDDSVVEAIRTLRTAAITGGHKPDLIIAPGFNTSDIAAELQQTADVLSARALIGGTHADVAALIAWQQTAGHTGDRLLTCWPNPRIPGISGDAYAEAVIAGFWAAYENEPNGRAISPSGRELAGVLQGAQSIQYDTDASSEMSLAAAENIMVLATEPGSITTYGGKFAGDTVLSHLAPRTVADYIYTDLDAVQRRYTRRPDTRANAYHIGVLGTRLGGRLRRFAQPLGSGLIEGGSVAVDTAYNNEADNLENSRIAYNITLTMPRPWGDITFRVVSTF